MSAAGELLEAEFDDTTRARGDIVMLTDDDRGVTETWMRGWNEAQHRLGCRVFGLAIGAPRVAEADSVLDALCDNLLRMRGGAKEKRRSGKRTGSRPLT